MSETRTSTRFTTCVGISIAMLALGLGVSTASDAPRQFRVWAAGDSHVTADIKIGRESLAKAIRQSEGREEGAPAFDWNIMIDVGDLSASQYPPTERDGRVLVQQYRALTKHYREDVYNVPGNHDAPYYDQGAGPWFRKWADPLGENAEYSGVDPKRRPYAVEGTWERYQFRTGNILFLMMSDRNDVPAPVGRGHSRERQKGGFPAGAVTRETFTWWKQQVLANQDKIIISAHHHMLRDTTMRSSYGEGRGFHGHSGGVEGSSYLYFIIENEDPDNFRYTPNAHAFEDFLEEFHRENGKPAIDLWAGGHSHIMHPEQVHGGKGITEKKWGLTFINASALTKRHGGGIPMSRLLTFTHGSDQLKIDLYLHEKSAKAGPVGWYKPASRTATLRHQFAAPPPLNRPPPPKPKPLPPEPRPKNDGPEAIASVPASGELMLKESSQWTAKADPNGTLAITSPNQRVNLGPIDMEDWANLTVAARIKTRAKRESMRVVSKDRIGQMGNFMLWFNNRKGWTLNVFDDRAQNWRTASWKSTSISDGRWHHLAGVADSRSKTILLYVDGTLRAESKWLASTLDDSDKTDLVVGTDSSRGERGHVFQGMIDDVRIYRRALSPQEIASMAQAVK